MQALRLQLQSTRNHTFGRSLCGIDNDAITTLNNSPDKDEHSRRAKRNPAPDTLRFRGSHQTTASQNLEPVHFLSTSINESNNLVFRNWNRKNEARTTKFKGKRESMARTDDDSVSEKETANSTDNA